MVKTSRSLGGRGSEIGASAARADLEKRLDLTEVFRGAGGGAAGACGGFFAAGAAATAFAEDSAFGGAAAACQGGSGAHLFGGWEASGSHTVRASSDAAAVFVGALLC